MKATKEEIKQIVVEEVEKYLEEAQLAKRLKNVGSLSFENFMSLISVLGAGLGIESESVLDTYTEMALDIKQNWSPRTWDSFPANEKDLFLKTTYPNTTPDESEDLMVLSFTNPTLKKVIYSDILLAIEKVQDAKKEIRPGKYLGPEEPGGEPKSPHWREYLEEIIKEEIVNHLKRK
jgi:hypothetical protein